MRSQNQNITGVQQVFLEPRGDARGYFMRGYDRAIFERLGLHRDWVQENESKTTDKHTVRGLHFQRPPFTETKLIRVVQGQMLDVFVDCRPGSPTYGQHGKVVLSENVPSWLYLPPGMAHGFCSLTDNVVLAYKVDQPYSPEHDGGIRWNDPALGIEWPVDDPKLSDKDRGLPTLAEIGSLFSALGKS